MNRVRAHQQPKQKNGDVGERKKPTVPPRNPAAAAPPPSSSRSSPPSPLSPPWSESPGQSTGASTPITIQQGSRTEIQFVQHASDSSSNDAHVTICVQGQPKIVLSIENRTDQQLSTVQDSSGSVEEEKRTDEPQAGSETEIEDLKMKVEGLTYGNAGLVDKIAEKERQREDTETKLREVAGANRALQVGITQRISEFANLSPEHAIWKQMSERWQNQEVLDDDAVLKKDYIECHKAVNTMVIEDYVLMHVEIDQQNTQFQHEIHILRDEVARERGAREQAEEQARELRAAQQENTQLQHEIQILRDQVAREQGAREQAEEQARELAAQQERITQLERENQRLTEQFTPEQEARNQAQEQAREQAVQLEAARDQVAEVQGQNDTLTQENNTLRTRVEELENQQNELQQRNNALEAQRRDDVDLILAILDAQQLRENFLTYHYNELLRQHDITRNDNEQLVQALVDTVTQYEDELAVVLCQMAEINSTVHVPEANDNNPGRPQPRSNPELMLVRNGSQLHSESLTPGGRWQQTIASRYAQRFPNSLAGFIVRALHFSNT